MSDKQLTTIKPRVSVLMTIYNAALFLRESVDSLISQSFVDWELIAVENGSSDETPSILAGYTDGRIRVFALSENIGRTPALRYAFDQARGDYIAVLDADDLAAPERLVRQVEYLDLHADVGLVGTWTKFIDEEGNPFAEFRPPVEQAELNECLGWLNPIVNSSAMYRRSLAQTVGGYPVELVYAQDLGLTLALAQRSNIAMIDEYLCCFRVLSESMTRSRKNRGIVFNEEIALFERAARSLGLSLGAKKRNAHIQAIRRIKMGAGMLCNKSFVSGFRYILRGFFEAPSVIWDNNIVRRLLGIKALSYLEIKS